MRSATSFGIVVGIGDRQDAQLVNFLPRHQLVVVRHIVVVRDHDAFFRIDRDTSPIYTTRSEEHTSELQSRENIVCRLLLEKKKLKELLTRSSCTKKKCAFTWTVVAI